MAALMLIVDTHADDIWNSFEKLNSFDYSGMFWQLPPKFWQDEQVLSTFNFIE